MIVALFFGGWLGPVLPPIVWFLGKTFVFICGFILCRAALPRPRYDQFMALWLEGAAAAGAVEFGGYRRHPSGPRLDEEAMMLAS